MADVICDCGDHINLDGPRDYAFINGKYYCVECMQDKLTVAGYNDLILKGIKGHNQTHVIYPIMEKEKL